MLINLWTHMMLRTVQWCVVRTAPRYLLPGGGSNPLTRPPADGHAAGESVIGC